MAVLFAAAQLAALVGCGDERVPLYPVQGKVLDSQGRPAVGAAVYFHVGSGVNAGAPTPVGQVDENGDFQMRTYVEGDGAPAGDYAVTIIWLPPRNTPLDPVGGDQLNGSYADANNPKLRFTVEEKEDNTVPTINLP